MEALRLIDLDSGDETFSWEVNEMKNGIKRNKRRKSARNRKGKDCAVSGNEEEDDYEPSIVGDDIVNEEDDSGERDEDIIDVDDEDGSSRLAKRGTLKHEAESKEHVLTHRYKNPYCDS